MNALKNIKENAQKITRKALVTAALGAVMMFSAQKANAQYLRFDNKSPVSTSDSDFSPAIGLRAVYAYTKTYQGLYPDYDLNVMFSQGKDKKIRAGLELNARLNLTAGTYSKHVGPFIGIKAAYADNIRDFGRTINQKGDPYDMSRAILAAQVGGVVNINSIRLEAAALLDTKGKTQYILSMNINMFRGKFPK